MDPETVDSIDNEGNTYKTVHFRGHVFIDDFPKNPETRLDAIQEFKCRKDDIIICTFPKSGSHWIYNIVSMMTTGVFEYKGSPMFLDYADLDQLERLTSPRVYGSHLLFDLLPKEARENKCQIIHLTRNPKDVLVSYYEMAIKLTKFIYRGTFDGLFRLFLSNKFQLGSWFNFERNWNSSQEQFLNHRILQLYYEEMKTDIFKCLKNINDVLELGRSDEFLRELEQSVAFEHMKREHEDKSHAVGGDLTGFMNKEAGVLPVYRKGCVGDWKNYFTVAQNEAFDKAYAEKMSGCNLELTYELESQ